MQEASLLKQVIYSNVKEILEQQHVFDSFWGKSVSAGRKIREIENEDSISLGEYSAIQSITTIYVYPTNYQNSYNYYFSIFL